MADFKVPNLCGASPEFNAIQTKFESMITSALDGLEVDASALKATLDTDVTALVSDLKAMVPELPKLPDVNLQAQLTSLSGLSIGSGQYNTLLADITTKFGSALTASGFSLDTLVSDAASAITGGTDLCSAVPNFTVPAAGGEAVQKAVEVLQAKADSEEEKPSVLVVNEHLKTLQTDLATVFDSFEEIGEEIPTADSGPYKVATNSTTIAVTTESPPSPDIGDIGEVSSETITITATTSKDAVTGAVSKDSTITKSTRSEKVIESGGGVTVYGRKNVSKDGFTKKPIPVKEMINDFDLVSADLIDAIHENDDPLAGGNDGYQFDLEHEPISILYIKGYVPKWVSSAKSTKGQVKPRWIRLRSEHASSGRPGGFRRRISPRDRYKVKGKRVTVYGGVWDYEEHPAAPPEFDFGENSLSGVAFKVSYSYAQNVDCEFMKKVEKASEDSDKAWEKSENDTEFDKALESNEKFGADSELDEEFKSDDKSGDDW